MTDHLTDKQVGFKTDHLTGWIGNDLMKKSHNIICEETLKGFIFQEFQEVSHYTRPVQSIYTSLPCYPHICKEFQTINATTNCRIDERIIQIF